jgi:hypothetical protein
VSAPGGGRAYETYGWVLLLVVGLFTLLYGASVLVFGGIAQRTLVGTFGAGTGIFSLAIILTAYRRGEKWAWFVLWYYPIFSIIHFFAFRTVVPLLLFLIPSVLGLLLPFRKFFSASAQQPPRVS